MNPILDALDIHARINLFLLEPLTDEQLDAKTAKGRAPRAQFVHMHNVRLMWLKSVAPELPADLPKLKNDATKEALFAALEGSAQPSTI